MLWNDQLGSALHLQTSSTERAWRQSTRHIVPVACLAQAIGCLCQPARAPAGMPRELCTWRGTAMRSTHVAIINKRIAN